MESRRKLTAARLKAANEFPYFATGLYSLVPVFVKNKNFKTMGVTKNGILLVSRDALERWTISEIAGVLLHEMMHVIRDHHDRGKGLAADPLLWNMATDLAINDSLRDAKIDLPQEGIFPEMYNLPEGKTEEFYYSELRQMDSDGNLKKPQEPAACGGFDGSGGGKPIDGEEDEDEAQGAGRSKEDLDSIRSQQAEEIRAEVAKNPGSVSAGIRRWAEDFLKPSKVCWKQLLKRSVRKSVNFVQGQQDFYYGRPARRQASYGFGLGKPVMPAMRAHKPHIAVAVDTSGSMSKGDLEEALIEIHAIMKNYQGVMDLIVFDCEVHVTKNVKNVKEAAQALKGGGGTSFVPVFEEIEKMKQRPNILVVATDGFGDAPASPIPGLETIWLLVGEYTHVPSQWGITVRTQTGEPE
jgi:predicted metal-dependent peptidase